ncbi:MAG: diadenylate cyclase CdaA [Brevinema sp.]
MIDVEHFSIIFDILLTSIVIYALYYFFRGTRTASIVKGILFLITFYIGALFLQLHTLIWLFTKFFNEFPIIMVIIFHQEIRQFFSNLGQKSYRSNTSHNFSYLLSKSLVKLSEQNIGALIIVERTMKLNDFLQTGIVLDARFSTELILSIFYKSTVLHDGAVIIRNEKILAANVLLPVVFHSSATGTRHGTAISISEERDCIIFVVSEETGTVSYARGGILTPIPTIVLEDVVDEIVS